MRGAQVRWCERCERWYRADEKDPRTCTVCGQVQLEYRCYRCGRRWTPKKESPKTCPKCGSPYWERARVMTDEEGMR